MKHNLRRYKIDIYERIKKDVTHDYYTQNFPNEGQRFVAWYLRNIHLRDSNQTRYDVTDGRDDKQIDAIVVDDDNSMVYVIQGKFIGAEKIDSEPLREVLSSWIQLKNLPKLQENANTRLKQRLVDLSNALGEDYAIEFELVTTAHLTDSAQADLKLFQEQVNKGEEFTASLRIVDEEELSRRYEAALEHETPSINHTLRLTPGTYLSMELAGTNVVIAAIPLKDCITLPGIKDGYLFRKNVRQFMGLNNRVNKGIKSTIYSDKQRDFFFYHNGITAICDKMERKNSTLVLKGLSVINGCQSLNTILACSERIKELDDSYILFRFYEIPQRDRADKISTSTNFQSAVKPRDLRSNDRRVLELKRLFEQQYPSGFFITKRGEEPLAEKDKKYVVDLVDVGKWLISWHSQRPNIAYSETKIFDKYFEQLFKRNYNAENVQALNFWMQEIMKGWTRNNPFGLNESLLAMKSYIPFHVLYALSQFFAIANSYPDRVPEPMSSFNGAKEKGIVGQIVPMAASCLNIAIEQAAEEYDSSGKIFSPQNWVKTKTCLSQIKTAVRTQVQMLPNFKGGKDLKEGLVIPKEHFEYRWEAD